MALTDISVLSKPVDVGPPTDPSPSVDECQESLDRLTRREVEVLYLVANGWSSKQIADRLCLAKRTIDFHISNIYGKLGVSNRVQAFRAAARMGLVPIDGKSRSPGG